MPAKQIDIAEMLHPDKGRTILDVRSPGEYRKAHIPGALNLPLFSDEERAIVGTAYKQESPEKAMLLGLGFAGRKMIQYVSDAMLLAPDKKILLHCWRGGKRSESMGWLLAMAGFNVEVLRGGYKRYRRAVLEHFSHIETKMIVIGGLTGSGKTRVLHQLETMGEQIIDLEKLAKHKGSAFGSLGEAPQPSTELFENLLFEKLRRLDPTKRVFIENESRVIGKCQIPLPFFERMKSYYYVHYTIPFTERIQHLVTQYAAYPKNELKARFEIIKSKLGGDRLKIALHMLDADDFAGAAGIALHFYDKTYQYGLENNPIPNKLTLDFGHADTRAIAENILQHCKQLNL